MPARDASPTDPVRPVVRLVDRDPQRRASTSSSAAGRRGCTARPARPSVHIQPGAAATGREPTGRVPVNGWRRDAVEGHARPAGSPSAHEIRGRAVPPVLRDVDRELLAGRARLEGQAAVGQVDHDVGGVAADRGGRSGPVVGP